MALNETDKVTIMEALQEQVVEIEKIKASCDTIKAFLQ